jgi:hypothetical protein
MAVKLMIGPGRLHQDNASVDKGSINVKMANCRIKIILQNYDLMK